MRSFLMNQEAQRLVPDITTAADPSMDELALLGGHFGGKNSGHLHHTDHHHASAGGGGGGGGSASRSGGKESVMAVRPIRRS